LTLASVVLADSLGLPLFFIIRNGDTNRVQSLTTTAHNQLYSCLEDDGRRTI
jgi:hypothetical protein